MRRKRCSGFSLIEVMVTVFIVGLVSGTLALIWGNAFHGRSWAFKKGYHATALAVAMRVIQNDVRKSTRLDIDPTSASMSGNVGKWLRGAVNIDQDGCFPTASVDTSVGFPGWYWYCITAGAVNSQYNQTEYDMYRYVNVYTNTSTYPNCPRTVPAAYPIFAEDDPLLASSLYFPSMTACGSTLSDSTPGTKILSGLTSAYFSVNTSYPGQVAVKLEIYKPSDNLGGVKPITESVDIRLKVQRGLTPS